MIPLLRSLLRATRATSAPLMLGVFLLGAALHGLHHLQDPACTDGVDRSGHACTVCASLHGSTLVAAEVSTPAPLTVEWTQSSVAIVSAPARRPRPAATPRAPPAS